MYFKKIEIVGFKSFLNKTRLKFEPGVTAIVGPNGCGKSNIVDAIKWVLGEQSTKSMRSSSMQDVIFNGTEKHDAVSLAEVSLYLSNEDKILPVDYTEVVITRRLYRSGESEYLLNKMPVRLTDIRNLLMGTGIGTTSYSIVEQGRMDLILSSKPEERRYVFEEASGITRYKARKREAMLKLQRTNENLVRINDIITEVERQIRSIERQARKAERYRVKYDELKVLEAKCSFREYTELDTSDNSISSENYHVKETMKTLSLELEKGTEELSALKEEFGVISENIQKTRDETMRMSSEMDKNRHTVQIDRERIEELGKFVERLDWEIEESTQRREVLTSRVESLKTRFRQVSQRRLGKEAELSSAEENIQELAGNIEEQKAVLSSSRERILDIISEQTNTKNSLIKLNADTQNMLQREKRLKMERAGVRQEKEKAEGELRTIGAEAHEARRKLEEKRAEFKAFNDEYVGKQHKLNSAREQRAGKEKDLNEIRPRRRFLEKLISEREGVTESVKEIMRHAETGDTRFRGVRGILSEIINVNDEFEETVESVLGDSSNALVVENREDASRIMSYLSENSMESVNFVILEELGGVDGDASGRAPVPDGLRDITDIISAASPYNAAFRRLLPDTYALSGADGIEAMVRENRSFDGRVLGEKGEIYRKGLHRSRNFSQKEVIPLFGRKEKVRQMLSEEKSLERLIEQLSGDISGLESWLADSAARKEKMESELRGLEVEFANISHRKSSLEERSQSLTDELDLLDSEIEEEETSVRKAMEECAELEKRIEGLDGENRAEEARIGEAQRKIDEYTNYREETVCLVSDIKIELSGLRKEEENLEENLERENSSFLRVEQDVSEKRNMISDNRRRIEELSARIEMLGKTNSELAAELEEEKGSFGEKEIRRDSLSERIESLESALAEKKSRLDSLKDGARDRDIRKKEIEYRKSSIIERMKDLYRIDITAGGIDVSDVDDWGGVTERIAQLKSEIEKMGQVSLGAVDEHKELEERYSFLVKQRDDLVSGRESLMNAIAKINRTTRNLFMESFEKIRKEFNDYFKMLFNGGKADLVLEDESNVLECGIDIVVRPPGKKLHNIMQLSGGEKAMTAIALIFAIFKVNPSPFCVLDEIDAPLDESNIVRFCRVLQDFLKLSQFIIVTHNRMTIQLADVLYGITMEEKGVSKIVSVKFTEEKGEGDAGERAPAEVVS